MNTIEQQREHVSRVLEQMLTDYENARAERRIITDAFAEDSSEFSLLEELDLLTADIRGIGSRFVTSDIDNYQESISQLERLQILSVPSVAKFYFDPDIDAERMKAYVSLLDYLRLLLSRYLQVERAEVVAPV